VQSAQVLLSGCRWHPRTTHRESTATVLPLNRGGRGEEEEEEEEKEEEEEEEERRGQGAHSGPP